MSISVYIDFLKSKLQNIVQEEDTRIKCKVVFMQDNNSACVIATVELVEQLLWRAMFGQI